MRYLWFNEYMTNLKLRLFDEQSLKAARKHKRSIYILIWMLIIIIIELDLSSDEESKSKRQKI